VTSWSAIARRIRVPVGFAVAALYLWLAQPSGRSIAAGALVCVPGICLRALASGYVRKNEELTTTGPYARIRNPLYLGSVIIAAGFVVAARSWLAAAMLALLFAAVYLPVIRSEEDFLRAKFPEYAEYAARVPRLLPGWHKPSVADQAAKFSATLYRQHREYNALLGSAAMFAALAAKLLWHSQ
jgi:protein-S-isoprenylcysteine O-methyltransferase Ste14